MADKAKRCFENLSSDNLPAPLNINETDAANNTNVYS